MKTCNRCETKLVVGENWSAGRCRKKDYICRICIRDRKKAWTLKNPESKKQSDKSYYVRNKQKIYQRIKSWKQDNKEHCDKYYKDYRPKYREQNKHKINNYAAKRRAYLYKACIGNFQLELENIYKNCPKDYHVDHIVPLQAKNVCGLHVPWNLQYLPALENIRKGNRLEECI